MFFQRSAERTTNRLLEQRIHIDRDLHFVGGFVFRPAPAMAAPFFGCGGRVFLPIEIDAGASRSEFGAERLGAGEATRLSIRLGRSVHTPVEGDLRHVAAARRVDQLAGCITVYGSDALRDRPRGIHQLRAAI